MELRVKITYQGKSEWQRVRAKGKKLRGQDPCLCRSWKSLSRELASGTADMSPTQVSPICTFVRF